MSVIEYVCWKIYVQHVSVCGCVLMFVCISFMENNTLSVTLSSTNET